MNAIPVSCPFGLGLEMVKVRVEVPPGEMMFGTNDFTITGGFGVTINGAQAVIAPFRTAQL